MENVPNPPLLCFLFTLFCWSTTSCTWKAFLQLGIGNAKPISISLLPLDLNVVLACLLGCWITPAPMVSEASNNVSPAFIRRLSLHLRMYWTHILHCLGCDFIYLFCQIFLAKSQQETHTRKASLQPGIGNAWPISYLISAFSWLECPVWLELSRAMMEVQLLKHYVQSSTVFALKNVPNP